MSREETYQPEVAADGGVCGTPARYSASTPNQLSAYRPGEDYSSGGGMLGLGEATGLMSPMPSLWDNELMEQLFEVQPNADWFDSGIFRV